LAVVTTANWHRLVTTSHRESASADYCMGPLGSHDLSELDPLTGAPGATPGGSVRRVSPEPCPLSVGRRWNWYDDRCTIPGETAVGKGRFAHHLPPWGRG